MEMKEVLEVIKGSPLIVGMTGTRNKITIEQASKFIEYLKKLKDFYTVEFHSGDCVGADDICHKFAKEMGMKTVIHPPEKDDLRAFGTADVVLSVKSYFARNRAIVDASEMMFVIMKDFDLDASTGGTIYTYNYAMKKNKPTIVIFPDGTMKGFNGIDI